MEMTCPVCGGRLSEATTHCSSCAMNSGCDMVCCDNCGYETVAPRSAVVDFFKRLLGGGRKQHGSSRAS